MKRDLLTSVWHAPDVRPDFTPRDWEAVLGQARRGRLIGRLARHFLDRGWLESVPAPQQRTLRGALRLVDRQQHEVRWETACIVAALQGIDTPVVMLKGAAYFVAGLPPMDGRLFADIDILVARDKLPQVEMALFAAGWIGEERDAYNQRYYRQWMHELPPLRHVERGTVVDVHHTVTPPTSRFAVDGARLLAGIVPAGGGESRVSVLAPVDMVLHSAVHLFQEGEFDHGLRDLLDLNDLLRHFGRRPGFWPGLFERAVELGLGEPLSHALDHLETHFGTRAPAGCEALRRSIRPGWLGRRILPPLFRLALRPNHPSSDLRFTALARSLLYMRSHFLRMPPRLAIPHLLRKAWMRRFARPGGPAAR